MNIEGLRLDNALGLLTQAGWRLPDQSRDGKAFLQALLDGLCDLTSRDPLTGLYNRRTLMLLLDQELDRVSRAGDNSLLFIVDIDHFKRINDEHGHVAGDAVIRAVGQVLHETVRPMDTVARYGGEEFAVVLPCCPPSFAQLVGERIRSKVEAMEVPVGDQVLRNITVSCGGAYAPPWLRSTATTWVEHADEQMYRAKSSGRNQVCIAPMQHSEVSAEEKSMLFGLNGDNNLMMGDPSSP